MSNDYGGKCILRLSTGERFSLRASVKHMPSGIESASITNQDATNDRVVTLKDRKFEITFADKGIDYEALMSAPRFNVTIVEDFTGVTHLYNSVFMVGEPNTDRGNGEVTGLSGSAETYIRKNRGA